MDKGLGGPDEAVKELGSYRLLKRLGNGGMGVVYEAEHRLLGRRVAIKVIRSELAEDATFSRRFLLEARAVAALDHPGIVRLYDFAFADGKPYMVMEYVTGRTLLDVLRGGRRLEPAGALSLLWPVARALDHAHQNGVVHRDVKPANILLAEDGRTLVMDFGLACLAGFTMSTSPDTFLGTPDYISPEQVVGQPVEARSDVYSLAAVVYEAIAGAKPFQGDSWIEVASRRLYEPAPLATRACPDLPEAFARELAVGMDREPGRRPASASDLLTRLQAALNGTGPVALAGGRVGAGMEVFSMSMAVLLAGLVGVAGISWLLDGPALPVVHRLAQLLGH
ncbi:MAG TPA: serine/threonine-protein kinase [Candidatus Acidoferrales bacterium]|nr:serine/threonine-protein kinase [Candidatus Acidoferrales bacterium]